MELKKSPKADLQRSKSLYFQIGLIVALALTIGAFSMSQTEKKIEKVASQQAVTEMEMIEVTRPEEQRRSVDMPKQTVKVMSDILNIVKNDAKITDDIDFAEADENLVVQTVDYGGTAEGVLTEDIPFYTVEDMPKFQGGDLVKFRNWVGGKLKYPQAAQDSGIQGRVTLSFVIEKDGSLTNIEVLQNPHQLLVDEAIRVVKTSPKWTPGKQRGNPVRVKFNLPVDFRLGQ